MSLLLSRPPLPCEEGNIAGHKVWSKLELTHYANPVDFDYRASDNHGQRDFNLFQFGRMSEWAKRFAT